MFVNFLIRCVLFCIKRAKKKHKYFLSCNLNEHAVLCIAKILAFDSILDILYRLKEDNDAC